MSRSLLLPGLALVFFLVGCGRAPSATITLHGGGDNIATAEGPGFVVEAEPNSAELQDGRLTVNGKRYGTIGNGDRIVVESNGRVLINDKERSSE
jgi:hypothetical protein